MIYQFQELKFVMNTQSDDGLIMVEENNRLKFETGLS